MGTTISGISKMYLAGSMESCSEDRDPILRQGGKMYLLFDSMTIEQSNGSITVIYWFKGDEVFRMDGPHHAGNKFHISGIEGRMRFCLE